MGKVSCDCSRQSQEAMRRTYQAGQKEQRKRMHYQPGREPER
jgi:hypothetical protein